MLLFLLQAVIISLTGVMAPGAITAVTVGSGTRSPHAGALVAIGHGIVEFPLMVLIYFGLGEFLLEPSVKTAVFGMGGLFLVYLGIDMLRSAAHATELAGKSTAAPLAAGAALSLGNAYFLLWWATVGASLITRAVSFGLTGVLAFAMVHWLCDFGWLYALSIMSYRGGHLFGLKFKKAVFIICGIALCLFGVMFLTDAGRLLFS